MAQMWCLALPLVPKEYFDAAIERAKQVMDLAEHCVAKGCAMWNMLWDTFRRTGEHNFIYIY